MKESLSQPRLTDETAHSDSPWAVDELNLAEFPLAAISERFLDGTKTVVFEDTVWDYKQKRRVPRSLTISGSDRYGLPRAKDDDVLLACIQVSNLSDFASREVKFSRYELLNLLRWRDETRNYRRLSLSLRRWKGLSVFSDKAFYDKARESWVNRDFGVLDNLYIYERESEEGRQAPASSWFVWNEVLLESFQAGYLKRLDWNLYCRLESPVAKRLYRFLDKRFYHSNRIEIELGDLALCKIRISSGYNTGQMKRALLRGIEELESKWSLKRLDEKHRFQKVGSGQWTVVFERRRRWVKKSAKELPVDPASLEIELTRRGIGPAMAAELVAGQRPEEIQKMSELFDWYNGRGQLRGPGFLVQAIRNPLEVMAPKGFEFSLDVKARHKAADLREQTVRKSQKKREQDEAAAETARLEPFWTFWRAMKTSEQELFEQQALKRADRLKRQGYYRAMGVDEQVFEQYRQLILRDHFEHIAA